MYGACYPIMALSVLANKKKKKPQILGWEVYIRIEERGGEESAISLLL